MDIFRRFSNKNPHETKEKYRNKKPGNKSVPRDFEMPPPPLNEGIVSYAAMLEDLDTGFGMILDKLDELGISENTYVIFTSDNGGGFRGNDSDKVGGMFVDFYAEDNAVSDKNGYEILELMRERLSNVSGYIVSVEAEKGGPPIGKAIQLNIKGDDEITLKRATKKIRNYLENEVTGLTDIRDSSETRGIEGE